MARARRDESSNLLFVAPLAEPRPGMLRQGKSAHTGEQAFANSAD
jgi:hypothetical protein